MATKLKEIELDEISFVDQGANLDRESGDGAHVLLWKREEPEMSVSMWTRFATTLAKAWGWSESEVDDLAKEITPEPVITKEQVVEPEAIDKRDEELASLRKSLDEAEASKQDLAKRLEVLETEKAEAEALAKAEAEQRKLSEAIQKAESEWGNLPGDPVIKGQLRKKLEEVLDVEEFEALQSMLKAGNEFANLEPVGKDGVPAEETPMEQLNRIAKQLLDSGQVKTLAEGVSVAAKQNPDLVVQIRG